MAPYQASTIATGVLREGQRRLRLHGRRGLGVDRRNRRVEASLAHLGDQCRPILLRPTEIVIEQLVHEPEARLTVLAVLSDCEAHILVRDQHDDGDESEHTARMPDDPVAAVVAHLPAQRVLLKVRRHLLEAGERGSDGLDRLRRPHLGARFLAEQPPALGQSPLRELDLQPAREIVGADGEQPRGCRSRREIVVLVEEFQRPDSAHGPAGAPVRRRAVRRGEPMRLVAGRVEHAGRLEDVLADVVLVRLAAHQVDHVTRDDIKNVVVRVAAAEAGRGLDESQALDDFGARQRAARDDQQIARAETQAAAMHEQIAHRHLAGDPRVVHLKAGNEVRDAIVPLELAGVDERCERGGGHRLAGRAGHEDGVAIDLLGAAEFAHAESARERDLAILDDRDRHARNFGGRAHGLDARFELCGRRGPGGQRRDHSRQCEEAFS